MGFLNSKIDYVLTMITEGQEAMIENNQGFINGLQDLVLEPREFVLREDQQDLNFLFNSDDEDFLYDLLEEILSNPAREIVHV